MWMLRINMTDRTYDVQEAPEAYAKLGGRAVTTRVVSEEVPPDCHPLSASNKLVFAPGIVTGTMAPSSSRLSVGAKSPLTGTIKESNAGSAYARQLANMRIKAIVVEGQPQEEDAYWTAEVTWDDELGRPKVEFSPTDQYKGQDLYDVFAQLEDEISPSARVAAIGPAGEYRYGNSGIAFSDLHKRPTRYSGRGGLGAVMGSKGLKFLILDDKGAPGVEVKDEALLKEGAKKLRDALMSHDITKPKGGLNSYGTAVLINIMNEAGGLPTRNFSSGRFEGAAKIAGEAIFEGNKIRQEKELYNHACSPGCVIQCSNTWFAEDGSEIASCVEYESDWSLGANCGIDSLDEIAEMVRLCNAYGLDTIETGTAIGVAMEGGLLEFGDGQGAIELIHEMGEGTPMGRILGGGTELTAKALGVVRAPVVKGQSMPAYDPRAVKGIGITYATTTQGADHTAGYTIAPEILAVGGDEDPLDAEGKADLSRAFQSTTAFIDSTGHCLFIAFAVLDIASGLEGVMDEVNAILGTEYTVDDITKLGDEVLRQERAFNEAAGFTKAHDRLPRFMREEPLPPHDALFTVPDSALDSVYGDL